MLKIFALAATLAMASLGAAQAVAPAASPHEIARALRSAPEADVLAEAKPAPKPKPKPNRPRPTGSSSMA